MRWAGTPRCYSIINFYVQFPGTSKVNLAIMPKSADERTLEHYNAVLCLSKLAAVTDAVLLFDNEVRVCAHLCHQLMSCFHSPRR